MKKFLLAAAAASLLIVLSCQPDSQSGGTVLNVVGDSAWTGYDKLLIEIRDGSGQVIDTIFNGKLGSLDNLKGLPSGKYQGGNAVFIIRGFSGDTLKFEESRDFDEAQGIAKVETTFFAGAVLSRFEVAPESLTLYMGGPDSALKAVTVPAYAAPSISWAVDGAAAAVVAKDGEKRAVLKPKQPGKATLTLTPAGSEDLARKVTVTVVEDDPVLEVIPAKAFITPGKTVEFSVTAKQAFGDLIRFQWDLDGDGQWDSTQEGSWKGNEVELPRHSFQYNDNAKLTIRFRAQDTEGNWGSCEALVEVGERKPAVLLQPKDTLISIKDEVRFTGSISEYGGKIVSYGWDYNGDGKSDNQGTVNDSVAELTVSQTYPDTGTFSIALSAKDADGKFGTDTVRVSVIQDPPVVDPGDAVVAKSNTPVAFKGSATQRFGTFTMYKWDFDGDGSWDDSSKTEPDMTHKYVKENVYTARLLVRDDDGNETIGTRKVTISDVPFVITAISKDDTVSIKDPVTLSATVRNDDGKALTWTWDLNGDGKPDTTGLTSAKEFTVSVPFKTASQVKYKTVFQVEDAGGKILSDTVTVTVLTDAPKADLGDNVTALVGDPVPIKLIATQQFGTITKRELQIGDTTWIPLSKQDTTLTMPAAPDKIRIVGRVTDDDGLTGVDTIYITVKYPVENHLSGIFLATGTLSPGFNPDTSIYSATYAFAATSVSVGAAARDPKSTVTINGTLLTGSVTSVPVALAKVGVNPVVIVVSAQDTSAKRTYTVNLIKNPSTESRLKSLVPTAGTFAPAFVPTAQPYTLTVPDSVDTVQFTPAAIDTMERFTVAGTAVASNTLSQKIPVKIGTQKIDIVGTAGSGAKSTYTITIVRKGWTLASERGFTAAHQGLYCMVASGGTPYIGLVDSTAKYAPLVMKGDSNWTALPALPQDSGSYNMALDVIGGTPYLMSVTRSQINFTINFRKYSGAWTTAARSFAGGYGALDFALDHDKANVPYYGVELANPGIQTHFAYKWKDTAWTTIAGAASHDSLSYGAMVLNRATGTPVLAANKSIGGSYVAAIYTVSGTAYVPYGSGSTWPVISGRIDVALDSLGTPYVAYMDGNTKRIGVRKYNGSSWVELGPTGGFSDGDASSVNIAVIGGAPVVAYRDAKLAKVMSKIWTGAAWIDFGETDFVLGDAQTVRMAADNTAVWIAFSAAATGDKVTVMRRPLP